MHIAPKPIVIFITMPVVSTGDRSLRLVQSGVNPATSLPERHVSWPCRSPFLASRSRTGRCTAHPLGCLAGCRNGGRHDHVQAGHANRLSSHWAENQGGKCPPHGRWQPGQGSRPMASTRHHAFTHGPCVPVRCALCPVPGAGLSRLRPYRTPLILTVPSSRSSCERDRTDTRPNVAPPRGYRS